MTDLCWNCEKFVKEVAPLDKNILVQYREMMEEIKDIRRRRKQLEQRIQQLTVVSDTVKGTRKDGTIGCIKITGYPVPEYYRNRGLLQRYDAQLARMEGELLELAIQAEEYIQSIDKSELRIMFRFYFIDGLSYEAVAYKMNRMFPKRKIKYTDENIRKRIQRFLENFENVPQCPVETC